MKKILCLLIALTLAFAVFGCNQKATNPGVENNPPADSPAAPPADSPADSPAAPPADSPDAPPAETPAADDDLAYIQGNGKIIIGITEYEPMNYYDETGALVGFDTEFAEALCAKLGITPEFKIIDWSTKEIELKAKNIDCIWNGLTVTEERRENMAFSTSYLRNEQAVVIRASDAEKYTTLESLMDAMLVAEDSSAGASAIEADLAGAAFTPVVSQAMALLEVKAGTADVAVIDLTMARAMTGEGTDYSDLMLVSSIKMMPEEYAIGLRLGSSAVEPFNEIIAQLASDGTFDALGEKYGVSDLLVHD